MEAIGRGCQGFVVKRLQERLGGLKADGNFGGLTENRVEEVQTALGWKPTGWANQDLFEHIGARWPSVFERCLQITGEFEGTGFGGVNKTDIDGAGVTLGIVGFTTKHGEVQRLLSQYVRLCGPDMLRKLPSGAKEQLLVLSRTAGRQPEAWENWFYGKDGVVDAWIRDVVRAWGEDPLFQRLQLEMIEAGFWRPVEARAAQMGLKSSAALGLLFDCQVQNGGFTDRHLRHYNAASHDGSELAKMHAVATAVAACASAPWRKDVLTRKMVFVEGVGKVHGRQYHVETFGLSLPTLNNG